MRCMICNVILDDVEATHKDEYGVFVDTCFNCLFNEADPDDDLGEKEDPRYDDFESDMSLSNED